jgi:hypothetical protein
MIRILEWNVGYETADTRKLQNKLPWVRMNVLLADQRWAELWLEVTAPQIWAGWTALVFCASQSKERGTVESVKKVAILSRVPESFVQVGLEWALANGMAESDQYHEKDSGKIPERFLTTLRDVTGRDATNETSSSHASGQASRLLLNDWTPDSGHSGICAQRNLSMEMQLERFRIQHGATLDTPDGWSRRFYGWIAQGRPEPIFSPAAAMVPPTLEQWTDHAYQFASTHQPFKREDPDYFWPGELARAKWNSHQAAGWARIVDWKAQLEADCETWNGYERANRKRPAR